MTAHAIVFDCDGVLIDSERVACLVDARELTAVGISITAEALARRFSGVSYDDMYRALEQEHGVRLPADYAARAHALVLAACDAEGAALAMPGIHALLDDLGERVRGVASSSKPDWLRRTLGQVDLWRRFAPHIYSVVEVARGKPAPDLFLHAAARLGVAPADCLVIEDSVAGVQAARAAGMAVFGFCGGGHCPAGHGARLLAEGAAAVFDDMAALAEGLRMPTIRCDNR
ncbi:MAG: HAD family phosphatase [Proteobacteria bacterium]|nr:HAD family phosphatase [Pseudomonadota bacterium]